MPLGGALLSRGTLQVKAMTPFFRTHRWAWCLGAALGVRADGRRHQGIHTSGRRLRCASRTRSGPETSWYDCGTRAPQDEKPLSDGGVPGQGPTQPIAHIALLTTALKSAYGNRASLSTRTATELREPQGPCRPGMAASPCRLSLLSCVAGLREACYQVKAAAGRLEMTAGFHVGASGMTPKK